MGSFKGHTLPGSMFICIGLYWCIKYSYRFFRRDQRKKQKPLYKQLDFWECAIIIFLATFGLIIEQMLPWEPKFRVTDNSHTFTTPNNWQHSTMYAFFILAATAKIFVTKFPALTPHCAHHVLYSLAFAIEGYLFFFHTHGRKELDIRLHVLLIYASWTTAAVFLILAFVDGNGSYNYVRERRGPENTSMDDLITNTAVDDDDQTAEYMSLNPSIDPTAKPRPCGGIWSRDSAKQHNVIHSLGILAGIMTVCHGCWFWQIAYVLYPPNAGDRWDEEDHRNIGFVTMFFTWYLFGSILTAVLIHFAIGFFTFRGIKKRSNNNLRLRSR